MTPGGRLGGGSQNERANLKGFTSRDNGKTMPVVLQGRKKKGRVPAHKTWHGGNRSMRVRGKLR